MTKSILQYGLVRCNLSVLETIVTCELVLGQHVCWSQHVLEDLIATRVFLIASIPKHFRFSSLWRPIGREGAPSRALNHGVMYLDSCFAPFHACELYSSLMHAWACTRSVPSIKGGLMCKFVSSFRIYLANCMVQKNYRINRKCVTLANLLFCNTIHERCVISIWDSCQINTEARPRTPVTNL